MQYAITQHESQHKCTATVVMINWLIFTNPISLFSIYKIDSVWNTHYEASGEWKRWKETCSEAVHTLMYFNMPEIIFQKNFTFHFKCWDLNHCWSRDNWHPVDAELTVLLYTYNIKVNKGIPNYLCIELKGWISSFLELCYNFCASHSVKHQSETIGVYALNIRFVHFLLTENLLSY